MYNDQHCALEFLKKTTGVNKIPFGRAFRLGQNHEKRSLPGQREKQCVCVIMLYDVVHKLGTFTLMFMSGVLRSAPAQFSPVKF